MPTISVIVPVYKVEPYIHRCIDSIIAQTYSDFELILVDDGSPDNCGAICDEYATKDNRIHVIHQENGGLSAARNAGIDWAFANSDSEWLYFADSDDWIHPKSLEALINGAQQTQLSVIIGGYERTEGENPEVDEAALSAAVWDTEEYFCKHNVNAIVAWGKLYRSECFETIRYPIGKIHEDEFVTYKILFAYEKLAVINQPLYAYYQNPNGIINAKWSPARLLGIEAFEEQIAFFKKNGYKKAYEERLVHCTKDMFAYAYDILPTQTFSLVGKYISAYKRRVRYNLVFHHSYFPLRHNKTMYCKSFPMLAKLYRTIR